MIQTLNSHYEVILEIKRFRKCRKITTQKLYPLNFRISLSKRTKNRKIWNILDYKGVALRLSSQVGIFLSEIRGKFLRIQPLKIRSSGWLASWIFFRLIKFVTSLEIKVANLHFLILEIFFWILIQFKMKFTGFRFLKPWEQNFLFTMYKNRIKNVLATEEQVRWQGNNARRLSSDKQHLLYTPACTSKT